MLLGLALMSGGKQTDPNVWNKDEIYSDRRITLAPIMMLAGFLVVIWGIFKRSAEEPASAFVAENPEQAA